MKNIYSRILVGISLAALLIASSGCLTQTTIKCAEGHPTQAWWDPPEADYPPRPGYYALLPLTVPADIVTAPFLVVGYVVMTFVASFGIFPPISQ